MYMYILVAWHRKSSVYWFMVYQCAIYMYKLHWFVDKCMNACSLNVDLLI